ncbi:hypothetical protein L6452_31529 [Arctium lappa]|uniref:Uncharacterized protein n=1 Tax=Arctium lappa TaxID=4217 RepID=A0ACB8Z1Q4_ARCLA|nr:hypothetical protein L6452_31529 [Arctium lappa]
MAVQAQYPSNVLLLNRTVGEGENDDCSLQLQSQPGGTTATSSRFVDDPSSNHILFTDFTVASGGGVNSRKRRREINMNQLMSSLFHQQQFQNQFVDVTQLRSRNVDVSTGLRLAFNDQQQLQQHSFSSQSSVLSLLTHDLSTQINQQRDEIEHFLHAQGEELRRTLANKRQMHYCALLRAAEESISLRMKDKDAEAEKAARRNAELEARAANLSAEAQVWQARARAQEAEAAALQSQLQQAIIVTGRRAAAGGGVGCSLSQGEEVGLRCAGGDAEDAESAYIDPERVVLASGPGCKACGKRVASVVLLPCRHLCVCTECDGVVQTCPLCLSFRTSSIEVYMS